MNIISLEFICAGRCSACVKGKRAVEYCRLLKKHNGDKAGVCANCYKAQLDQSVMQCRQVLGHKASNALTTEILVVANCSKEENVQSCISSGFTPCCSELVSFSTFCAHPDVQTTTTASCKEWSEQYGVGYLVPFTKEMWEEWHKEYSLQGGIDNNIETGNQTN